MNNLQSINIKLFDDKTIYSYIDNGNKIYEVSGPIGYLQLSKNKYSSEVKDNWLSYIMWLKHIISYVDNVPTTYYLDVNENSIWFKSAVNNFTINSYNNFFVKNKEVCVIIIENNSYYERHKKILANFQFKI